MPVDARFGDAGWFRLAKLLELMDQAGVGEYRSHSRDEIASLETEVICRVGREEFREAVRRSVERVRSLSYDQYLLSGEWQTVRYFALRQAGFRCAECGRGRALHIHHRTYERLGNERLGDVMVLCKDCHASAHGLPSPPPESGLRPIAAILEILAERLSEPLA